MRCLLIATLGALLPTSALADDAYSYDSLSRLNASCHTMGLNAQRSEYALDSADNRANLVSIPTNFTLQAGSWMYSPDGRFGLTMQTDGNLVLYFGSTALWQSGTAGSGGNRAVMQKEGNLVVYTASNTAVWASSTTTSLCGKFAMQNDGNLVIYSLSNAVLWTSATGGH